MKRFLFEVAFFFLLLFAGAYFLDAYLSGNLKKSHDADLGVWNDVYSGNVNSDIVVYGASRAWVHFDPSIISESLGMTVYNLGIDGHNFWLQYLRHSVLLKYNSKPKVIVQSVDMSTLQKRKDLYDPDQFLPYMLNDPQVEAATSSYEGYTYLDYHVPMLRYYGKTAVFARAVELFERPSGYPPKRIRGYQGQDRTWNGDWERAKRDMQVLEVVPNSATIQLFDRYLKECRALGIKVIFVNTPEYIEAQQLISNRAEILGIFEAMSQQYGIPFLDYSRDSLSYETQYFYNSQHMNRKGAEQFTKKLMADLRPLVTYADVAQ